MEARLSASRSMVAISSTVGKDENSSGLRMNRAVIITSTEKVMEMASAKSSIQDGIGRMRTTMIVITPSASASSERAPMAAPMLLSDRPANRPPPAAGASDVWDASDMGRGRSG